MESKNTRKRNRGIEENTMAILDSSGVKEARDIYDDRLTFVEAVRATSLVPESGTAPTSKMYEAILQIMKDSTSVELVMASYQLLTELDKRFPRVHVSESDSIELVQVEEAWSPFALGPESVCSDREATDSCNPIESLGFSLLIQDINKEFEDINCQVSETKPLRNMLLFQYLVNVLEHDFFARRPIYEKTMNWTLLRESYLNMLLGSRRINYKSLVKDCLSIVSKGSHHNAAFSLHEMGNGESSSGKATESCDVALATSLTELQKGTCVSIHKFMIITMELDMLKKNAESLGCTSRADGVRTSLIEIILDELTYDEDLFSAFLEVFSEPKHKLEIILQYFWKYSSKVFSEPKHKLEIILQYFWKYSSKPAIRTRRSNSSTEDATFDAVLKCFSNNTSTKSIMKKISTETAQLLLAHAFQAYISLQRQMEKDAVSSDEDILQICRDLIASFQNLKKTDKDMEIIPFGKQALFTAATLLLTRF